MNDAARDAIAVTAAGEPVADARVARQSSGRFARELETVARGGLVLVAIAYMAVFAFVAVRRCVYPYELEWMEGAMVAHVDRVVRGQPLYVAPTIDFVPFIYGPVYFWVAALFAKVLGVGFTALRLVSIVSTFGAFAAIYALVARETHDRPAGIVAAGAFAASYVHGAQFFDIARVDSITAIHLVRHHRARLGLRLLAAVLLGLSFMTKQSMLFVAVAAMIWELVAERRRAIPFVAATLIATLGFAAIVDVAHGGWFRYYVWDLPSGHPLVKASIGGFWTDDLFPAYAIAGMAGAWYLLARPRANRGVAFYLLFGGGLVAGAWAGRLHDGGWSNVLIPAFAALSIFFGLGFSTAWAEACAGDDTRSRTRRAAFVVAVAAAQLLVLAYDPRHVLPKRGDALAGQGFVERLRAVDGDVFVPDHAWYARLAGKRVWAHRMAIDDVLRGDPTGEGPALVLAIRRAIETRRWSAIVLDDDFFEDVATASYRYVRPPFDPDDSWLFPVTGIHVRPTKFLVAK